MKLDSRALPPSPVDALMPSVHRILLVEDHPALRRGLSAMLEDERALRVEWNAGTVEEAYGTVDSEDEIDLILLDLSLPDGSGVDFIKQLRARKIEIPILVFSRHDETAYGVRCLQAGAQGYVTKSTAPEEVVAAIRDVLRGSLAVSAELRSYLLNSFLQGRTNGENADPMSTLSDRQLDVFRLIGEGHSSKEIAELLNISTNTVYTYRQRICEKFGIESSSQLVRLATHWAEGE